MTSYYIHDGQNTIGPFTIDELKTKSLTNERPVWYEGLEKWTTVNNVPASKLLLTTPPPFGDEKIINSYEPMMNQYFPTQKSKTIKIPLIIGSCFIRSQSSRGLLLKTIRTHRLYNHCKPRW